MVIGAGPTGWSPRTTWPTPAGRSWSSRPSRRSAVRCAATATCTPTSSTTRSARSTRSPPPRRRSASFGLEQHGLRWTHAPAVLGHPSPDGVVGPAAPRPRGHGAADGRRAPGDGDAWLDLCGEWDRIGPQPRRRPAHAVPARPPRSRALARLRSRRRPRLRPHAARPAADLGRSRFRGDAPAPPARRQRRARRHPPRRARARASWASCCACSGQTVGFPVPEGGAGRADRRPWPAGSRRSAARSAATPP